MIASDLALGRSIFDLSWERLLEDFRIWAGRLFPLGLRVLAFAPMIAARWRGLSAGVTQASLGGVRRHRGAALS